MRVVLYFSTLFLLLLTRISPESYHQSDCFLSLETLMFFFSSHLYKWIPQKSLYGESREVSGIPWYYIKAHFAASC